MLIPVAPTCSRLLAQEDTDGDRRITVRDTGPRRFTLEATDGTPQVVEGHMALSNLLHELYGAQRVGQDTWVLNPARLHENPVHRLARVIREQYWEGLTYCLDADGLPRLAAEAGRPGQTLRLYLPFTDPKALVYFQQVARQQPEGELEVVVLPEHLTPEYVLRLHDRPGLLSRVLEKGSRGRLHGLPFVLPGGGFQARTPWDLYGTTLGLLADGRVAQAQALVENACYDIRHYGQVLGTPRSDALARSHPPFLTAMALAVFDHLPDGLHRLNWLRTALTWAIREYQTVWKNALRLTDTGLSRYAGSGLGLPPEAETGRFEAVLWPYARRHGLGLAAFTEAYAHRALSEPELDAWFAHYYAAQESGQDPCHRIEGRGAHLCSIDLNSLLYRYEVDIAHAIGKHFGDTLTLADGSVHRSAEWQARARRRRALVNQYGWQEERGLFCDYDYVRQQPVPTVAATTLWPLWAGLATKKQAERLLREAVPLLEQAGGLAASAETTQGVPPLPSWDCPFGWAAHQVMAWEGLVRYGYQAEAQRLAYRWLHLLARHAADYGSLLPEPYNVVHQTHPALDTAGGSVVPFERFPQAGSGWLNASFQVGRTLLGTALQAKLERLEP
jgi:alpha,alpha-trehalase